MTDTVKPTTRHSRKVAEAERAARWAAHRAELVAGAEAAADASPDAAGVIEAALALVDRLKPNLPTGGGLASRGAARPYAELAVLFLTRYPKEFTVTTDAPPAADANDELTLRSLAGQNAAAIANVEAKIDKLVRARAAINEEVAGLRGSLVALQAAQRHFVKLGGQLALPVGSGQETATEDDLVAAGATGDVQEAEAHRARQRAETDEAVEYFGAAAFDDPDAHVNPADTDRLVGPVE